MRNGLLACASILWLSGMSYATVTPNEFTEGTDSDRIEAAIARAV